MSWLMTIAVALITALICGAGALCLSLLAMQWYRVSSFEGKSGYAAISLAFVGTLGAGVIGFIAARVGVAFEYSGFGGQLLWGLGAGLVALGIAWILTRAFADIPPKMNGKELDVLIELRFPPEQTQAPTNPEGKSRIELGTMRRFKRIVRKRYDGELLFDQARLDDGRWIVPARIFLFTTRGRRLLLVDINGKLEGFLLPLPARPGKRHTRWSDWLPRLRPNQPKLHPNVLSFRYKVTPT